MSFEIREVEDTDLVTLMELFRSAIEVQGRDHYSDDQVHAWSSRASEASFADFVLLPNTYVAIDDSGPIGFCGYAPDGHITSLYIRPDRSGQGVGRALLSHVLEDAQAKGITKFHAEASEMAIPLFEKMGFAKSGFDEVVVANVHFRRQLMALECD